jgi:toxin HigB-1
MRIRSVRHKGLQHLIEDDEAKGIRRDLVGRVGRILTALLTVESIGRLAGPPGRRIHQLTGNRVGTWSLSVSGNRRITFDLVDGEVCNLDLEDYH